MDEFVGTWELVQVTMFGEYTMYATPEDMDLHGAHVTLAADGTFTGSYWGEQYGTWSVEGDTLSVMDESIQLAFEMTHEDGKLVRWDDDEEHGDEIKVEYVRAGSVVGRLGIDVARIVSLVCEADHFDVDAIRRVINEGGEAAVALLDDELVLCMAVGSGEAEVVELLVENGADIERLDEGYEQESMIAIAREYVSDPDALARIEAALERAGG